MKHDLAYDLAHAGDVEGIRDWLQSHDEDVNAEIRDGYSLLHIACMFGHEPLVRFLVDRLALVNLNATNPSRATPLHLAVSFRDEPIADKVTLLLINNGAELNAMQSGGQTALHHAVARGSLRLVRTLIDAGADPFMEDEQKRSPALLGKELPNDDQGREIREALATVFA